MTKSVKAISRRRAAAAAAAAAAARLAVPAVSARPLHFRWADLPSDLKFYLTFFFDRHEAVRLLLISSEFHEIFSRSVWRFISINFEGHKIPQSAWLRYGHLVRSVNLNEIPSDINVSEVAPNIMYVNISMGGKRDPYDFSYLSTLRNLYRVKLYMNEDAQHEDLKRAIEWINNTELSGHVKLFDWENRYATTTEMMWGWHNLGSIRYTDRHSISMTAMPTNNDEVLLGSVRYSDWACILPVNSIYYFDHILRAPAADMCAIKEVLPFLQLSTAHYQHLKSIHMTMCCDKIELNPVTFPVLEGLHLDVVQRQCSPQNGMQLARIIAHKWHNVIKSSLSGQFTSEDLSAALDNLPKLQIFTYNSKGGTLDLAVIQSKLCRLYELILNGPMNIIYTPAAASSPTTAHDSLVSSRIQDISIQKGRITIGLIEFIVTAAPRLRKVYIANVDLAPDVPEYARKMASAKSAKSKAASSSSLSHLAIGLRDYNGTVEELIDFISAFTSLEKLTLHQYRKIDVMAIYERFPDLRMMFFS
ncbi:hypothetical protein GQ42DRAFT_161847 [Ramicandelaber brevisporus]|nr:hypothetical protein GQ42DRAFT_163089 [Ramicandelaber brevisporus]KAI8871680.1 hypothetical protein GQ42DRAFT_161847 [Ramicandelaber brevisporus]